MEEKKEEEEEEKEKNHDQMITRKEATRLQIKWVCKQN